MLTGGTLPTARSAPAQDALSIEITWFGVITAQGALSAVNPILQPAPCPLSTPSFNP